MTYVLFYKNNFTNKIIFIKYFLKDRNMVKNKREIITVYPTKKIQLEDGQLKMKLN